MDTHKVTANFQLQFLSILHPLEPTLAARIGARIHSDDNDVELTPLHCQRCGHLAVLTRIVRNNLHLSNKKTTSRQRRQLKPVGDKRIASRYIRRTCTLCGHVEDRPCPLSTNKPDLQVSRSISNVHLPSPEGQLNDQVMEQMKIIDIAPQPSGAISSTPRRHSGVDSSHVAQQRPDQQQQQQQQQQQEGKKDDKSSKRPKKKTGLQEMLAREKERQKERDDQARGGGLAAFLSGL